MHPWHHAVSSAAKFGGKPEDYLPIHNWFDASKAQLADGRHRALRHHAEGIFACEDKFGTTLVNADGDVVPVRFVGEQHVIEDLGWIPSFKDWMEEMRIAPWMRVRARRDLPARHRDADKPPESAEICDAVVEPLLTEPALS